MKKIIMLVCLTLIFASCKGSQYGLALKEASDTMPIEAIRTVCDNCNFGVCDAMTEGMSINCSLAQALARDHFCTEAIRFFWDMNKPESEDFQTQEAQPVLGLLRKNLSVNTNTYTTKPSEGKIACSQIREFFNSLVSRTNCSGSFDYNDLIFRDYFTFAIVECTNLAMDCEALTSASLMEMINTCNASDSIRETYVDAPSCGTQEPPPPIDCKEKCIYPKECIDGQCVCVAYLDGKNCQTDFASFENYMRSGDCSNALSYINIMEKDCCPRIAEAQAMYDKYCKSEFQDSYGEVPYTRDGTEVFKQDSKTYDMNKYYEPQS
jgi:hypothetical protein